MAHCSQTRHTSLVHRSASVSFARQVFEMLSWLVAWSSMLLSAVPAPRLGGWGQGSESNKPLCLWKNSNSSKYQPGESLLLLMITQPAISQISSRMRGPPCSLL